MIQARVDVRPLLRALRTKRQRLPFEIANALESHAFRFEGQMRRTRFSGGADRLTGRTGRLARSLGHTQPAPRTKLDKMRMVLYAGQGVAGAYARIQEHGGVVTGQPWLTVPLPDNLTAGGVPRFKSARALMVERPGQTFVHRSKAGNLLIGLRETRYGRAYFSGDEYRQRAKTRVRWLWVLKNKVTLKPRLGMRETFDSPEMRRDRVDRFNAAVRRALRAR